MKKYGQVISDLEGPSTSRFSFSINKGEVVRAGQFVQIEVPDGKLIARVADVIKANRYFDRPETVSQYSSSGTDMSDIFPVDDFTYLVAKAISLGVFSKKGEFMESDFPPSPGDDVTEPEGGILKQFFGFNPDGLNIGKISYHDIEVKIDITRLFKKHLAVLAMSGAGKSHFIGVLIEEVMARPKEKGQISMVVIDPHGEYVPYAELPDYVTRSKIYPENDIKIGLSTLGSHGLGHYLPDLTAVQKREMRKVYDMVKKEKKIFTLKDLAEYLNADEKIPSTTKDKLLSKIYELESLGLVGATDYPNVEDLARPGQLTVIDLSDTIHMRKKRYLTAFIANSLFHSRKSKKICPFVLFLEEAHQFVPDKAQKEEKICTNIVNTIAREGRKFDACICLISQRPVYMSKTALSQCNTNVIFRVSNPEDQDKIRSSSEKLTSDVAGKISSLPVGTAAIVGEAVNFPLFVKIRNKLKETADNKKTLEYAALEFQSKIEKDSQDARDLM